MLSLKREAQSLTQQIDSWAESDLIRSLKKKNLQVFRKKNREKNREKNRDQMVMLVETSEDDLEEETGLIRKRTNISEEIGNGGRQKSDLMDEDYRLFLEKIGAFLERDLMETEDREEDFGSVSKDLENSSPNKVVVEEENVEGVVSKDLVDSTPNEVVVEEEEEEEEENVELNGNAMILREDSPDPDYRIFLDNLKEDGQFYVFENVRENGTTESIWYGKEDEDLGDLMDVEAAEHVAVAMNFAENIEEVDTGSDCIEVAKEDNLVQKRRKDFGVMRSINAERLDGDLGLSGGYCPGKKDVQTTSMILSGCQPEMIIHADDAYMAFLSHVRVTGKSLIYEHGNSIVIYDEGTVVIPDSEELEKKPDIHGNRKKFTPHSTLEANQTLIHEDDSDVVEILPGSPMVDSEEVLRKKLKKILKKPFDKKEFKQKLKAARIRKPLEKNRVMRGRDITYQTDDLSPSYLDLHRDLRNMLRSVLHENPKPKRALSLLRCLFFYYKNVCHPGSCQPWRNPPSWLHNKICSCPDYLNCHMQRSISQGKRRRCY